MIFTLVQLPLDRRDDRVRNLLHSMILKRVAWKHKNVYIDTSAYLPKYYPPALVHYMATFGKEKVMFGTFPHNSKYSGSNFPQLSLEKCMKQVDEIGLSGIARENFLWRNAERVFKLTSASSL